MLKMQLWQYAATIITVVALGKLALMFLQALRLVS